MLTNLRTPNKFIRSSFSHLTLLFFLSIIAFVQSYQGSLRGLLKDSSGNTLSAGTLTLTNEEIGVSRTTVTNDVGEYVFEKVDI